MSDRFIAHMLARNIRIEEDLIDQLFNSSEKRLARTLLLLARYGKPDKPVRVGGQIKAPRKVRDQPPAYPDVAKQARVEGVVVLEAVISPQGRVTEVKVLRGSPLLDDAAVNAVKSWVYTPTLLNGVPVPVVMTVTVSFKLS